MPLHSNISKSHTREIFSPDHGLRPSNRYLTELNNGDGDYCVMQCLLPPGIVVPLHSHSDRETFYVISGTPDAYLGDHWEMLGPGDVFDARDGLKHAWRNSSGADAAMLCVTTMRLGRFLRDISIDGEQTDRLAHAEHFLKLVHEYGYWLANPQENAAIGLGVNWDMPKQ